MAKRHPPADKPLLLTAYAIRGTASMQIVPAPRQRAWMDKTDQRFAYRCLPLLLSNAYGWALLNPATFTATWNGSESTDGITIDYLEEPKEDRVTSHFSHGILTWTLPYLFRTAAGYNLSVRGPTNSPKDGIAALDALVETDWNVAPFTMNWKFTRPHHTVTFERGEPICMLAPVRRGELEQFRPEMRALTSDPELAQQYARWQTGRATFLEELKCPGSEAWNKGWQKDYFQGRLPDGIQAREHQTKIMLAPFGEKGDQDASRFC